MAYFLRTKDYNGLIRSENLGQVVLDTETRRTMELIAQSEVQSYLSSRYLASKVFSPLQTWTPSAEFFWADRIDITGSAYSASTVYASLDKVVYQSNVYQKNATTAGYVAGTLPTNATYFDLLGAEGVYYVTEPTVYSGRVSYAGGTSVTFRGNYYERTDYQLGAKAIDPTDASYWTLIEAESIAVGTFPSDATKWTFGDNRNQQIVMYMVDVALYHSHASINPRNIPQLRIDRYNNAINWCKMVNSGDITVDLVEILPVQGRSISVNSNPKQSWYW